MLSNSMKPLLVALMTAACTAWPAGSLAESARLKEQPAEHRDGRSRGDPNRYHQPPRLRSPVERPAPDTRRPPRQRDDHHRGGDRGERRGRGDHDDRDGRRHPRWDDRDDDRRRWSHAPRHHHYYHHHHYPPRHGRHVHRPGPRAHLSLHFGQRYWFDDGYWYTPGSSGYVLVRPPAGVYLHALPAHYTLVRVGPHVYYHVNGVYYAAAPGGGYQVVEVPDDDAPAPYQPPMVYPARGQSPEQQSSDEYECHAWAVERAGFDPTLAPLGQGPQGDEVLRGNYRRALTACLEGRGYTVK